MQQNKQRSEKGQKYLGVRVPHWAGWRFVANKICGVEEEAAIAPEWWLRKSFEDQQIQCLVQLACGSSLQTSPMSVATSFLNQYSVKNPAA